MFNLSTLAEFLGRKLSWKETNYHGIKGTIVEGDADVRASSGSELVMFFRRLEWRKVAVIMVESGGQPFFAGFIDPGGQQHTCDWLIESKGFGAPVGHESARFFAVDRMGQELRIRHVMTYQLREALRLNDEGFPLL